MFVSLFFLSLSRCIIINAMNLKITTLLLCTIALLCSCEQDPEIPSTKPEPIPEMGARTVLAYIAADNSLNSFSTIDINEMVQGIEQVDTRKNNLLVYVDRYSTSPRLIRICRDMSDKVILDTLVTYTNTPRNSVGVAEMKEVLSYVVDNFPSASYGFIMWSHGDGWIPFPTANSRWIGQDTDNGNKDKRLNIDDLRTVLESQPKFEYIFFDACYMQSIEVAYELRHCANYFIGSPTEIPGPGAPYQKVVPYLFAKNDAANGIAAAYFDFYNSIYNDGKGISNTNWTGGVSIAVLRSDKLDALAAASRQIPLYATANINTAGILCYDPLRIRNYHDMAGLVKFLAPDASIYNQWEAVYKNALTYAKTTEQNYNTDSWGSGQMVSMNGFTGVSSYILTGSQKAQNTYYKTLAWYAASGGNN